MLRQVKWMSLGVIAAACIATSCSKKEAAAPAPKLRDFAMKADSDDFWKLFDKDAKMAKNSPADSDSPKARYGTRKVSYTSATKIKT